MFPYAIAITMWTLQLVTMIPIFSIAIAIMNGYWTDTKTPLLSQCERAFRGNMYDCSSCQSEFWIGWAKVFHGASLVRQSRIKLILFKHTFISNIHQDDTEQNGNCSHSYILLYMIVVFLEKRDMIKINRTNRAWTNWWGGLLES